MAKGTCWVHSMDSCEVPIQAPMLRHTAHQMARKDWDTRHTHTHTRDAHARDHDPPCPRSVVISGPRVTRRMFLQPQTSGLLSVAMPKLRLARLQKHMSFDVRKATRLSFFLGRCLKIRITKCGWLPFQHQPKGGPSNGIRVDSRSAKAHVAGIDGVPPKKLEVSISGEK